MTAPVEEIHELSDPLSSQIMGRLFPFVFASLLPLWIWVSWADKVLFPVIGWSVATAAIVWWAAPVRRVWLVDGYLVLQGGERVPFQSISRVKARTNNRTPSVLLSFSDQRGKIRRARILVGFGLSRPYKDVEAVAELLARAMYGTLTPRHIAEAISAGTIRKTGR